MKKTDLIWTSVLLVIITFLIYPTTHKLFMSAVELHPYLMGFVKFSILATMGELLALRVFLGMWKLPVGIIYRMIIWGFFGVTFVLAFDLFAGGVATSTQHGLLPLFGGGVSKAFFTSALMNLMFGPVFMALHRVTDTYIDLGEGKLEKILKLKLANVVEKIDWYGFISFVVLKTIPLFWIPAHTLTFVLPAEYRVLVAAFLSIALGGILAIAKKKNSNPKQSLAA